MYESDEVIEASQKFKIMVYGIINDRSSQREEAFNIGVANQTINNWLVNHRHEMPAFVLPKMKCGNIILEKLLNEWRENFGGSELRVSKQISEIEMLITEHIGVINSIIRKKFTLSEKNEAIERMQELKKAISNMEIELHRILENG